MKLTWNPEIRPEFFSFVKLSRTLFCDVLAACEDLASSTFCLEAEALPRRPSTSLRKAYSNKIREHDKKRTGELYLKLLVTRPELLLDAFTLAQEYLLLLFL